MSANPNSEVEAINTRLSAVEHGMARMREAFPQNSLKLPDYDGHRVAHEKAIDMQRVIDSYKFSATKQIIAMIVVAVVGFLSAGFVSKIGALLK